MHGQYDFLQDPAFQGTTFEWDTVVPRRPVAPLAQLPAPHVHQRAWARTATSATACSASTTGKPWKPKDLGNPVYALLLATFFQYGVMLHDLEVEQHRQGQASSGPTPPSCAEEMARKLGSQTLKDYVLWPLLTGPSAPLTFAGNAVANLARNLWSFTIIFCGHFPDGVATFTEEEAADESRGGWYLRQLLGSANIERRPAVPPDERQPQPPDRAPPVPRHPGPPLPGDGRRGPRDLRALRAAVQHRAASASSSARSCPRSCRLRPALVRHAAHAGVEQAPAASSPCRSGRHLRPAPGGRLTAPATATVRRLTGDGSEVDDGADAGGGADVVEAEVDVVERAAAGDQRRQVELAGLGQRR